MSTSTEPSPATPDFDSEGRRTRRVRRLRQVVVAAVLTGAAVVVWNEVLRDRLVVKNWGEIEPGQIYRSGQISKYLIESQLKAKQIELIIDLSGREPGHEYQEAEIAAAQRLGIELRRFSLGGDGTGDLESYVEAIASLVEAEQRGTRTLLHCQAGADRTGGVTYCYRTLVQQRSPAEALAEMQDYGWRPHKSAPLIEYLDDNMRPLAERLVERGIIDSVPDPLPMLPLKR